MRRIGWVLVGAAAATAAAWKVPAIRERLLGPDPVMDLPAAAGGSPEPVWSDPVEPAVSVAREPESEPAFEPHAFAAEPDIEDTMQFESVEPPADEEATGLRDRIEETRARMRARAQAEADRTRAG